MNAGNHSQRSSAVWRRPFLFAVFIAIAVAISTCLTAPSAYSAPRSACWEDHLYLGFESAFIGPITAAGGKVFVAGAGPFTGSPSSHAAIYVRAYNLSARRSLWENVWHPTGKDNWPTGIVHTPGVIVTAAETGLYVTGSIPDLGLALSAYSVGSGRPLWDDRCPIGSPLRGQPRGPNDALLALGHDVIVAGNCDPNETGVTSGLLRAYDARKGTIAWQVIDPSVTQLSIANDFTRVFDLVLDTSGNLTLRAYDGASGAALWETVVPNSLVNHIVAGDGRVFVAGSQIIALDGASGALEWTVTPANSVQSLAERRGRLFIAENGDNILAAAYSARTGTLLWQVNPGSETPPFTAEDVAAGRDVFLVAGTREDTTVESASHLVVRVYSLNGKLLSENGEPTTSKIDATVFDVAWAHGFSIVSGMIGHEEPPYGIREGVVRICGPTHP